MRQNIIILTIFLQAAVVYSAGSQSRLDRAVESDLFDSEEIIEVKLKMNIGSVTSDLEDRYSHWAELTYNIDGDDSEVIPLEIKTRGKTRANPKVCSFPPLRLNFKKKGNYDNLFSGQDKLKLVTHCQGRTFYDEYVLQEYLTYKHYNLLTDYSFKVRLLKVTYEDSAGMESPVTRYGFLIEDEEAMAHRNGLVPREGTIPHQDYCNREVLNIMTVFQYMIGNTDWSVPALHNIKLIAEEPEGRLPFPIPYDFDYSGAIATTYAQPDASLNISTVRTRVFRGFCRSKDTYEPIFDLFNDKKEDIYDLYNNFEPLSEKERKAAIKYFDGFYKIINNSKKARQQFNRSCRVAHVHLEW